MKKRHFTDKDQALAIIMRNGTPEEIDRAIKESHKVKRKKK